eukprot:TRINITY_DN333_c0_g1_i7.p2 TRINITY_DN333_c0_g1~~TRINITY_DN333_c0_g1_i7.p2  ORF type:complete len:230 (-),score=74.66 TRINITY_DN333_c0_g1_i7:1853-2542(-)
MSDPGGLVLIWFGIQEFSEFRGKIIHSSEAEVEMEKQRKIAKEQLEGVIEKEEETYVLLTGAKLEKNTMFQKTFDCITALTMVEDMFAFKETLTCLNIEASVVKDFCNLLKDADNKIVDKKSTIQYKKLIKLIQVFPNLKNLIQGFLYLYHNVFFQHELLKVVITFNDVATISSRIDKQQGEDIREETHDILHALRLLCEVPPTSSLPPEELLDFFIKCGGSIVVLAVL